MYHTAIIEWVQVQKEYIRQLEPISKNRRTEKDFATMRVKLSWISSTTRPDAEFTTAYLAQNNGRIIRGADFLLLNSSIRYLKRQGTSLIYL